MGIMSEIGPRPDFSFKMEVLNLEPDANCRQEKAYGARGCVIRDGEGCVIGTGSNPHYAWRNALAFINANRRKKA